jgi:hypothetical protein
MAPYLQLSEAAAAAGLATHHMLKQLQTAAVLQPLMALVQLKEHCLLMPACLPPPNPAAT